MEQRFSGHAAERRKPGRPLSFDRDAALEQAMLTFWRHGYETSSVSDLTAAMGITAPSLYAAFGDKKQLFLEAVRRYVGDTEANARAIDDAATACEAARNLLTESVAGFTGAQTPKGCLLASATASGSAAAADVQAAVTAVRTGVVERLRARIDRDVAAGVLPARTDTKALAGMVMTLMQGCSVMARDGHSRDSLLAIVELALNAWPASRAN